jgi:hypothetical protein
MADEVEYTEEERIEAYRTVANFTAPEHLAVKIMSDSLYLSPIDELVVKLARPKDSLDRSPKKNWVENVGGLPAYIRRIANDLHKERGMSISRAIATAISICKKWAAGGKNVKADTRAKAAAAIAEWEAKKARSGRKK